MNKQYIIIALTSLLAITFTACTERIELDLRAGDSKIVIYGTLTDTLAYQRVSISRSVPYFEDTHNPAISGARVSISSSDGEVWMMEESNYERGVYQTLSPKAGVQGVTYSLMVEYDFDEDGTAEQYEASSTMQPTFAIDSMTITSNIMMGTTFFSANLFAEEPAGEDYYFAKFYVNDSLATQLSNYSLLNDNEFLDGQYLNGPPMTMFGDTAELDRFSDSDRRHMFFAGSGDEIMMEVNRIEKSYFNFILQCQDEKNGANPMFGGPPSNIQGNISNGAVGFFAAYSVSRLKAIVP